MSNNKRYNDMIANYLSVNPKSVEGINNLSYQYYKNQLFLKLYSIFNLKNAPSNWDEEYFFEHLFKDGVVGVVDTKLGVLPLQCGFTGINVYSKPTQININNVVLGNFQRTIGKDGELVYLSRMNDSFYTTNLLVTRYALMFAQIDGSLNTSLMNSRVAHVFECTSNAELKTLQKVYDDVSNGKPAVFLNKEVDTFTPNNMFMNVKQIYIGNDLLDTKRTLMNEFLTEIGINNANTDKKERLVTDEVNANDKEINANIYVWKKQIETCLKKVNDLFGTNIGIEFNKEVIGGEKVESNKFMGNERS